MGDRLSQEDLDPGTGEIEKAPSGHAGPGVAQGAVTLSGSGADPHAGEVLIHAWTRASTLRR